MKKQFLLKGLDCPHCSAEIEKGVGKLGGIENANINLINQTLTVELSDNYSGSLFKDIEKIVHSHEPDVEVTEKIKHNKKIHNEHSEEHCCSHEHEHHVHGEHCHDHEHKHHEHGEHCHNHENEHHVHGEHCHDHEHKHHEHGKHCHDHENEHHEHGEHCHDHEHKHHEHGEHCHDHEHKHHEHGEHCHDHEHKHSDNSNKKQFLLKGLDCPHCSAEIEKGVDKLDGIVSANINLINQTLTVEISDNYSGNLFKDIEKIVHSHEPDVEVTESDINRKSVQHDHKHNNDSEHCCEHEQSNSDNHAVGNKKTAVKDKRSENPDKAIITRFIIGAVLYAIGFTMSFFDAVPLFAELPVLIAAYIILGGDVVLKAVKNISKGRVFDENFLMTLSTVGAFVIGEYPEAVAVMLFYQVGEFFQSLAVKRSRKSIAELMDIRPDSANVKRHGELETVSPEDIDVGEIIVVKPGEKIPLDGIITDGESMLDTRALTGESVPKSAKKGDPALSGCINESGILTVEVTKPFEESTASKIIDLVENAAGRKAPTENFITTFSRYYTPIVVILAALLAVIPPLVLGYTWTEWLRRGFVFLVISCPCALVISIPLTFFGGIGAASKKGVLVKGSNYLEALNSVETIVFDKTGTLTKGVFNVTEVSPAKGFTKSRLLDYAAKAECMSNHPIAKSIAAACKNEISEDQVTSYTEISGQGIIAVAGGHTILVGNEKLMNENSIVFKHIKTGCTTVHVAADGKYAGYLLISDEIKSDSKKAILGLKQIGIKNTVMLTGDNKDIAEAVAADLGVDSFRAELLPNQKVEILEELDSKKSTKKKLAFVGDGINDAPVLARADVGIAMGALGSDAAIEAADVVLMTDEPSKLIDAISVAKATKKLVTQNIVIVLSIKILFLILGAFGIAGMWEAVFGDVGVMIIAVINAMRILAGNNRRNLA